MQFFDGLLQPGGHLLGMIDQRQPAQRPQPLGLQRAGNVEQPATAEPLQDLTRIFA